MLTPSTLQWRPEGAQGAERLATLGRAILAAILVGLHSADVALAQEAWPLPLPIVDDASGDPSARYSLYKYKKYCPIRFESFLVEANNCKDGFIREFTSALCELVWWEREGAFDKRIPECVVTRVTAPPGYGKSALLRYLNRIILEPDSEIHGTVPDAIRGILETDHTYNIQDHMCTINLDELGSRFEVRSTMLDDLKNDGGFPMPAFGNLRAFDYDDHAAPGVEFLVRAFTPEVPNLKLDRLILIIDSIDEIYPDSAKSLLKRLDDYITQREKEDKDVEPGKRGFLRVFVVGRPEGFTDYYRIAKGGVPKTWPVKLIEPCYHSDEELVCAARSVVEFNILGGDKNPRNGVDINNMAKNAINFAKKHPWLKESFGNLTAFGDLIRFANVYTDNLKPPDSLRNEFQLKEVFFQSLLARGRNIHNRPASRSQEYIQLLEEIASKFARCHQIDKRGYFSVTPNDFVEIDVKVGRHTQRVSYLVESVLNRSGVVDLDSVDLFPRYRFYPCWVREHLLERHQRRLQELAEQGNCVQPSCCP